MRIILKRESKIGLSLLVLTCLELAWIASYSFQRMPSFDGSMNLQVAWSLSNGEGYRRTYADRPPFPPEVQTNVPLTVPAAFVFWLFDLGTVQAQMVNVLYLYGLTALCFVLLFKRFGWIPAGVCALLVATTPGIVLKGMNGYGEVIGLFWFVAALLVYPWTEHRMRSARMLLAGACLGFAFCTKIVMAICLAAFLLALVLIPSLEDGRRWRKEIQNIVLVVLGILIPVLAVEVWRLVSLGGIAQYHNWWWEHLTAVGRQAGVVTGYRDTPDLSAKVLLHLDFLAHFYGLPMSLLLAWIAAPFVLFASNFRFYSRRSQGVILCVLLAIAIYFVWWLAVTPSQKAWHRRILNGTLLLNFAWVYMAALILDFRRRFSDSLLRRATHVPMILSLGLAVFFFVSDVAPELAKGPEQQDDVQEALKLLKSLPRDARIYGIGWYSAPTLSLFSKRPLDDFNNVIVERLDRTEPVYIVLDQSARALGQGDLITSTYRSHPLLPDGQRVQIYEVDLGSLPSEIPEGRSIGAVPIVALSADKDPFIGGFYGVRARGGRWMTSDAYVNLLYEGSPNLAMTVEAASMHHYMHNGGVRLTFSVDDCSVGSARISERGRRVIHLPIPDTCRPQLGEISTVRISSDNLIDSSITTDSRAMSVIGINIGFVSTPSALERAEMLERELVPGLGFKRIPDGIRPVSNTVLRVSPNPVDFCTEERRSVEVTWDMSAANPAALEIWLEEPRGQSKLWISTGHQIGKKKSGDWVVEGMKFIAVDATRGKVLDIAEVLAVECK